MNDHPIDLQVFTPPAGDDPSAQVVDALLVLRHAGVASARGLAAMGGNRSTYCRIVGAFIEHHRHDAETLSQLLATGQWAVGRSRAHALKGSAAAIGAVRVKRQARRLERLLDGALETVQPRGTGSPMAAAPGPDQVLPARWQGTLSALASALDDVTAAWNRGSFASLDSEPDRRGVSSGALSPESADSLLLELRRLLRYGDTQALRHWDRHASVMSQPLHGQFPALARAIHLYDFSTALSILDDALYGPGNSAG